MPTGQSPAIPAAAPAGRPLLATITLVTLMLPVTFPMGSWLMSPSRLLFLIVLPFLMINLLSGKYGKITSVDIMILLYMLWRTFIPFIHNPNVALQYAGSNSVIILGGYLSARATIRSPQDFQWIAKVLGAFVFFSFPFALYEARTSDMVVPRFLENVLQLTSARDVNYQPRLGVERVQFVFPHPILYGLFCSMVLAIRFVALRGYHSTARRWLSTGIIVACCFMSVSSGPFLSALAQIGLIIWAYVLRNVARRWLILGIICLVVYLILEVLSNRPAVYAVLSVLAFNPATANVRRILLDYGLAQIGRTPILGIGFRQWDLPAYMSGSLDNYWLANALMFGLPAFAFLLGAYVIGMISAGRRTFVPGGDYYNVRLAWAIVNVSIMLTLATVYIWSEVSSLVFFVLGAGVFLINGTESAATEATVTGAASRRGTLVYSRFPAASSRRDGPDDPGRTREPLGRLT